MNSVVKISGVLALLVLTACATDDPNRGVPVSLPPQTRVIDNSCDWVKIITVSPKDVLTPETARQILTHDKTTKQNCPKAGSY